MDPDAEVLIASQPQWPFEYSIAGVCVREDVGGPDADESDGEPSADEPIACADGTRHDDVFLCEGTQLRYATKAIWECCR